ncbi:hypothetical protein K3553_10965 [Leisingera aquaemixtae]|uniref:hypothetical protein n=1 Tax=Leisingera aquaemixtae TaxID=1396826 RepID=UPI0021A69B61|nr:hypothetical protein [Leisingera aquaemixtae]UWQ23513.1 hypothetical protein K3553_10965 [Leisingera aquaemixtae]
MFQPDPQMVMRDGSFRLVAGHIKIPGDRQLMPDFTVFSPVNYAERKQISQNPGSVLPIAALRAGRRICCRPQQDAGKTPGGPGVFC